MALGSGKGSGKGSGGKSGGKSESRWIGPAVSRMKRKGTLGSFGPATPSRISKAKKAGGRLKRKAIFAQNVANAAHKRMKRAAQGKHA